MLLPLAMVGIALFAFGALVLLRFSDRPGGDVRLLGLRVTSVGSGLPLIVLGVFVFVLAAIPGVHTSEAQPAGKPGAGDRRAPSPMRYADLAATSGRSVPLSPQPVSIPIRSRSMTIANPPGNEVPHCWLFHGDARLGPGKTLVVASRRVKPPDDTTYFQAASWTGGIGQSTWRARRYFGTQTGQRYRVSVLAITTKALEDILGAHGSAGATWEDRELPRVGAEIMQLQDVRQIPGMGNC